MNDVKLCICTDRSDLPVLEQTLVYKRAGYDGFFSGYASGEQVRELAKLAKRENLIFQSIHAPFGKVDAMWREGEAGDNVLAGLCECVDAAASVGVDIVVCHVWIGFYPVDRPGEIGLDRFARLIAFAAERGVKIAFENTEGEEFLAALFDRFGSSPNVGFCWDSGHERCYNGGADLLKRYGNRLIGTHINDNFGVRDEGGKITWLDDLHLIPGDGTTDWQNACRRLAGTGFDGPLTFELLRKSKPDRHENDKYSAVTFEEYVAMTYAAARKIADMFIAEKSKLSAR